MIISTPAIVVKTNKYSDSSLIAKLYTKDLGLLTFMVKGAYRKSARISPSLLQLLNPLEIIIDYRESRNFHILKDAAINFPLSGIQHSIEKKAIVMFVSELLYKCLHDNVPDSEKYTFLENQIRFINQSDQSLANYPLFFMIRLSRLIGFYPDTNRESVTDSFDMQNGYFIPETSKKEHFLCPPFTDYLIDLAACEKTNLKSMKIPKPDRKRMMYMLIDYYKLHLQNFRGLHSISILETVMES